MCGVATTEPSPVVQAAAAGELPDWAKTSAKRREHMMRVAALMDQWAEELSLPPAERIRWRAAGWLHDTLRNAEPESLRAVVPQEFQEWPGALLHGPAAAARLEGSADAGICTAIRYHTLGHPLLPPVGKALYLADFLEPARSFRKKWRARLRQRMPGELPSVLREVAAARIGRLLEAQSPIRPETSAMWNSLVGGTSG